MSVTFGPKLGLLINADINEQYFDQFRPFLRAIDALLDGSVLNSITTTPPLTPNNGDAYLLLSTPSGAWTGHQNQIAVWSTEITETGNDTKVPGWDFYTPKAGWMFWDVYAQLLRLYSGNAWTTVTGGGGGGGGGVTPHQMSFTTTSPGNFTVAHGFPTTPAAVTIEMTSGGQVWFQTPRYDDTNIYLVATDSGLTGSLTIWE